ncbi:MAG: UvrD-helicase domain-containing protein, partial [Methanoregulaceae archaeon]|nr:UvrD-helicase domain-containing protein [Methanoregulaceae archaeon]
MAATPRQAEAISTHDRSMVVTAGAGTGKTYVLVRKYIDLLESQDVQVPEILALTFTDKAAAEMRERIRKEISLHEGLAWEKAAEDFMIAPVQTFHSFCAQVLREFPIEAGLEPGFVVLDERQALHIHGEAFEELVHTSQPGPVSDAVVHVLSVTDQYPLRSILAAIYGKRWWYDRFFDAFARDECTVVSTWVREIHEFRDNEIRDLASDRSFSTAVSTLLGLASQYEGADDRAAAYLCEIRPLLGQLGAGSSPEEFCCAATALIGKKPGNVGSRKVWDEDDLSSFRRARKDLADILERKKSLFRMTVDPADPVVTGSVQFLRQLSLVFSRYRELVEKGKANAGGLDFGDLILQARRLFLEQGDLVKTHFKPRYRYILVDEFQDTDPTQFDIILSIVGTPDPSTNCLFIVGDPKQSIYLFRDADVTRFKEAQRIILDACLGRVVSLDTSFRSTKEVIALTNLLFSRLFASTEKPWEFGYEPILAAESRLSHSGSLELLLAPGGDDSAATKRSEADMVARRIYRLVRDHPATSGTTGDQPENKNQVQADTGESFGPGIHGPVQVYEEMKDRSFIQRPARYGDVAILLEARSNLSYYLQALSTYGIPYYVHGGTGFYSRQEVYDLYNLLRFLEHRHDDISLAGVLRSPYFGLPDTELYLIAQEHGRTLWHKLERYAEKTSPFPANGNGPAVDAEKTSRPLLTGSPEQGASAKAARARDLLSGWQKISGRTSLVTLIRKILSDSGIYTVYAALPDGKQILANVEKMIAMARSREASDTYALADFTADIRTAMDEEEREGEAPLDALAENAVNIMTVHAAKGLEFPIVIVPDMGRGFREKYPPIMIGDNPLLVGVKVPNPNDNYDLAETPVLTALREMQRQKERAERKRLLYVALTRTRDHLIMSGTAPENPDLSINLATSRIEWIFPALGITGDAIAAGGIDLSIDGRTIRLAITSDPAAIPAETGRVEPELIEVPAECTGKSGTWTM